MIKVFGSLVGKEEMEQVDDSVRNQWLGSGPKLKEFEQKFKDKINTRHFLMIDNASNGLYLAIRLLYLTPGSEIILPTFTWIACAHAIRMCDCVPVFCDIDYHTQNITAALIEPHITERTRAIMVVHYAGLPVDMDPVMKLGFPVIEDSAHAVDSVYKGRHCGTIGEFGIFSFDSMKNIAIGEGGGFTCKLLQDLEKATRMRLCGMGSSSYQQTSVKNDRWWEQEAEDVFIKMNPSDISAGFALAQFSKLSLLQAKRKTIWDRYIAELASVEHISLPVDIKENTQSKHSYFTFLIKTEKRDDLAKFLLKNGIYSTLRFFPIHLMKIYYSRKKLINAEQLKETGLNIPLHPALSENEQLKIIKTIKAFFTQNS